MKKSTKIWLITATSLVALGCIMFSVAMTKIHWDFTKLSTVKYETNTYEVTDDFNSISMLTDTADILFVQSDDKICKVVCYEMSDMKHTTTVQNNTLTINVTDEREWYDHIGITLGSPKITVYLPKTEYDSLAIKEDTGDIEVPEVFKFKSIDIATSTGDIIIAGVTCEGDIVINVSTGKANLTDIKCKSFISDGSTGDISLKNVIATEKFSIERSTGDVKFDACDATEIWVETDTGDVTGKLLSEKIFITETSTGDVNVPKSTNGGKCEITTSTGDIHIK
jgi:DUF4097 and DUF4098 domain-containing protein YvlB